MHVGDQQLGHLRVDAARAVRAARHVDGALRVRVRVRVRVTARVRVRVRVRA